MRCGPTEGPGATRAPARFGGARRLGRPRQRADRRRGRPTRRKNDGGAHTSPGEEVLRPRRRPAATTLQRGRTAMHTVRGRGGAPQRHPQG